MRLTRPNMPDLLGTTEAEVRAAIEQLDPTARDPFLSVEGDVAGDWFIQAYAHEDGYHLEYREGAGGRCHYETAEHCDLQTTQRLVVAFLTGGENFRELVCWQPIGFSMEDASKAFLEGSEIQDMPDQRRSIMIRRQWKGILIGLIWLAVTLLLIFGRVCCQGSGRSWTG